MDFIMQHSVWMLMEMLAHVRGAAAAFHFLLLLSGCGKRVTVLDSGA